MITISFLGSEKYLDSNLCLRIQAGLAGIYETDQDEIMFYAPESFLIHGGVEQTSFQIFVEVEAPKGCVAVEKQAAAFLRKVLKEISVHSRLLFRYYEPEHEYIDIDSDYPRYMTADNTVKFSDESADEEESEEDEEEPYLGNAFAEVEEHFPSAPESGEEKHEHECCCGHGGHCRHHDGEGED